MMRAMVLETLGSVVKSRRALRESTLPNPEPGAGQVLIRVYACGVCHTELDQIEGRLPPARLPIVPGHQVVGEVAALGVGVHELQTGQRVGVGWFAASCGVCHACVSGDENLCPEFRATGHDQDGGYAEFMVIDAAAAFPLPAILDDVHIAPLLCAGAIGWRSLRLCGLADGERLGLTGFGSSAHLVLQLAKHVYPHGETYVFARSPETREFARDLGATWAGGISDAPPVPLDAIIDTTPAWTPIVCALSRLRAGGRLVVNAIRKEDGDKHALLDLDYARHLWQEKLIRSVANVAPRDIAEFLDLAAAAGLRPKVTLYGLPQANQALWDLREGTGVGAKVLAMN